ncbi:FAD-dependent oxidoreductase [Streptomyces stramineus]
MRRLARKNMHSGSSLNRRSLLKAAGTTALAAGAASALASPALAGGRAVPEEEARYDAIVIGAGFAGVTAARELRNKGLKPLVLEARDRIGGRVWTSTWAGEQVELGGAWLHPNYELTYKELNRYGLKTISDAAPEKAIYPTPAATRPSHPRRSSRVSAPSSRRSSTAPGSTSSARASRSTARTCSRPSTPSRCGPGSTPSSSVPRTSPSSTVSWPPTRAATAGTAR